MGDGVLISETAFPKDGKEVDVKEKKRRKKKLECCAGGWVENTAKPQFCLLGQNPWWTSTHERKRDVAVPSGFLSSSAGCRQVSITSDAPCFD